MPSFSPRCHVHCWLALTLLSSLGLLTGCATSSVEPPAHPDASVVPAEQPTTELVPVVRYGRYTLIELVPDAAQQDLLQQVIDISIPTTADATVGDALRHVLRRSGYRLCDTDPEAAALHALPLPTAHLHLGPLVLRDALMTLAGPAWDLSIDDSAREVCFTRHAPAAPTNVPSPDVGGPTGPMGAATTFPVPEVQP